MRALIFELRPGNLEQDGLIRALRTHTAALQGRIGLPVVVESTVDERLPVADRGGPLPDRPGSPAQRGQARQCPPGPGRGRPGREAASACASTTTARASIPSASPDGHLGLAGMRARADQDRRPLLVPERAGRRDDHRGRRSRRGDRRVRCARRSPPRRHRSATDDVGRLVVRPMAGLGEGPVPRRATPQPHDGANARRPRLVDRAPSAAGRGRCRRPRPRDADRGCSRSATASRSWGLPARPDLALELVEATAPGHRRRRPATARDREWARLHQPAAGGGPGVRVVVMGGSDTPRSMTADQRAPIAVFRKTFRPATC